MYLQRTKSVIVGLVWFVGMVPFASAEPSSAQDQPLSLQVSTARVEVDTLAERLETQRLAARDELSGLRAERAELQRQVRLEQIRKNTLAQLFAERTKRIDDQEGRMLILLKPIKASVLAAQAYVKATLPFKRDERLLLLTKIEADLSVTHPHVGRALTKLWRFIEEEEAMAREVDLAQQVIELQGNRLLADVARIGMALMYFRLPNGEFGWVRKTEKGWRYERIQAEQPRAAVAGIFEDLEKNQMLGAKRLLISTELPSAVNRDLR